MRSTSLRFVAILVTALSLARGAGAGEVFVSVASAGLSFTPPNAGVLSTGDFVIWTWAAGGHTVTSGTTLTSDGEFDSFPAGGTGGNPAGTIFAWKTDGIHNPQNYYCRPHFSLGMKGSIPIGATTGEADLRITEVRYDGVDDFVEIGNLQATSPTPGATANLAGFRLSINGGALMTLGAISIPDGGFVKLTPGGLTRSGSVALYAPYLTGSTVGTGTAADVNLLVDYVEWGASGGQPLENVAAATVSPIIWTAGDFAPQVATGHSIMFCGARLQYGASWWKGAVNPTPGAANDCATPVIPSTWGRIKTLYR